MAAIFTNLASGTITDNPLTNSATTVNSAAFATLPVIAAPDFMWLTLDPTSVAGTPEIVKITTHTNAATVCTIVRGQQTGQGGGAARQHLLSTKWAVAATANDLDDLPHRLLTTKGAIVSASAANTPAVLVAGTNGQELIADSTQASGLKWANTEASIVTTKGDVLVATSSGVLVRQGVGADHSQLTADSSQTSGVRYAQGLTTKGDLATFDSNEQRLAVGANQQFLNADSTAGTGLAWTWNGIPVFATTAARDAAIASPTTGMVCYIKSNDSLEGVYFYQTTGGWRPRSWNAPWGNVGWGVDSTVRNSSINSGVGLVVFPTVSFTPLTGRLYKVTWKSSRVYNNATTMGLVAQLCDQAGGIQDNFASYSWWAANAQSITMVGFVPNTWATGSLTGLQVRAVGDAATAAIFQYQNYGAHLMIEDVGPSGAPA
jgi:hypothetical protein